MQKARKIKRITMSVKNWILIIVGIISLVVVFFFIGRWTAPHKPQATLADTTTIYINTKPDTLYKGYKTEFKVKYINKYIKVDSSNKPIEIYDLFSDTSFVSGKDTIEVFNVINTIDKNAKLTTDLVHKNIETFVHDTTITKIKIPVYIEKQLAFYETQYFIIILAAIAYLASLIF